MHLLAGEASLKYRLRHPGAGGQRPSPRFVAGFIEGFSTTSSLSSASRVSPPRGGASLQDELRHRGLRAAGRLPASWRGFIAGLRCSPGCPMPPASPRLVAGLHCREVYPAHEGSTDRRLPASWRGFIAGLSGCRRRAVPSGVSPLRGGASLEAMNVGVLTRWW